MAFAVPAHAERHDARGRHRRLRVARRRLGPPLAARLDVERVDVADPVDQDQRLADTVQLVGVVAGGPAELDAPAALAGLQVASDQRPALVGLRDREARPGEVDVLALRHRPCDALVVAPVLDVAAQQQERRAGDHEYGKPDQDPAHRALMPEDPVCGFSQRPPRTTPTARVADLRQRPDRRRGSSRSR